MLKPVIAATALLAIAGSSYVYAQQRFDGPGSFGGAGPRAEQWHRPSAADAAAFTDARIAALKAGLELNDDQQKNWPGFEQALRDMAQLRVQRMQAREAGNQQGANSPPATLFDRLGRRADNLSKVSAALKRIADTGAPLYQSLDDAQKARFMMLARMLRPHLRMYAGMSRGFDRDGRGFGRGGRGFGPNGQGYDRGFGRDGRQFNQEERGSGERMHAMPRDDEDRDSHL